MRPIPVFDEDLEFLGVLHSWQVSLMLGEMDQNCTLWPNFVFMSEENREKCFKCDKFNECFPRLLLKLPTEV